MHILWYLIEIVDMSVTVIWIQIVILLNFCNLIFICIAVWLYCLLFIIVDLFNKRKKKKKKKGVGLKFQWTNVRVGSNPTRTNVAFYLQKHIYIAM
jgi:hypothetical protein